MGIAHIISVHIRVYRITSACWHQACGIDIYVRRAFVKVHASVVREEEAGLYKQNIRRVRRSASGRSGPVHVAENPIDVSNSVVLPVSHYAIVEIIGVEVVGQLQLFEVAQAIDLFCPFGSVP
jgi:hypothetical protein